MPGLQMKIVHMLGVYMDRLRIAHPDRISFFSRNSRGNQGFSGKGSKGETFLFAILGAFGFFAKLNPANVMMNLSRGLK